MEIHDVFIALGAIALLVMFHREWPETKRYFLSTNLAYWIAYLFRGLNRFQKYSVIVCETAVLVFDAWLLVSLPIGGWEELGVPIVVLNLFIVFMHCAFRWPEILDK